MPIKVKVIGDLHSVPHYRCGACKKAVQVFIDDHRPSQCPWCHAWLDWKTANDDISRKEQE